MNVTIIGTGYVGLVTAAALAHTGHQVVGMDDDAEKIALLERGERPCFEPHLDELIARQRAMGRLRFTTALDDALTGAEVAFICVGTPAGANGEADLSAVEKVARRIGETASAPLLVVEKSTVPAQTGHWIARTLAAYNDRPELTLEVASNPEFQREGAAVEDFLHPDRLVFGVSGPRGEALLRALYAPIIDRRFSCPIHPTGCPERTVPVLVTDLTTAELIKHAANSFLATKISFINLVADLCERLGADIAKVSQGMAADPRISPGCLQAGLGFGGSCFPKDLLAFAALTAQAGLDSTLLREVSRLNSQRIDRAVDKLSRDLWVLRDKVIGLLGLAFKPQTDDVRNAPAIALAERLLAEGAAVRGYDPRAAGRAVQACRGLVLARDPYDLATGVDALVLCTEWPEFLTLDWNRIRGLVRRPVLLDARNALDRKRLEAAGFRLLGMGFTASPGNPPVAGSRFPGSSSQLKVAPRRA